MTVSDVLNEIGGCMLVLDDFFPHPSLARVIMLNWRSTVYAMASNEPAEAVSAAVPKEAEAIEVPRFSVAAVQGILKAKGLPQTSEMKVAVQVCSRQTKASRPMPTKARPPKP